MLFKNSVKSFNIQYVNTVYVKVLYIGGLCEVVKLHEMTPISLYFVLLSYNRQALLKLLLTKAFSKFVCWRHKNIKQRLTETWNRERQRALLATQAFMRISGNSGELYQLFKPQGVHRGKHFLKEHLRIWWVSTDNWLKLYHVFLRFSWLSGYIPPLHVSLHLLQSTLLTLP